MIDICITATRRPEILDKTLKSFTKNLFWGTQSDFRVIINVDPVGEKVPSEHVVGIVHQYFADVKFRIAKTPHFPTAFIWCWSHVKNPYVFQLEEDWELLRPINFDRMLTTMKLNKNLMHLRLSTWKSEDKLKQWKWLLTHNGSYFEVPQDVTGTIGFCGHPSLNTKWFIQTCLKHMIPDRNPEKQIKWRNKPLWELLKDKKFGVFQEPNSPVAIRDIGRRWMVQHGFKKKGNREWFTEWEKA